MRKSRSLFDPPPFADMLSLKTTPDALSKVLHRDRGGPLAYAEPGRDLSELSSEEEALESIEDDLSDDDELYVEALERFDGESAKFVRSYLMKKFKCIPFPFDKKKELSASEVKKLQDYFMDERVAPSSVLALLCWSAHLGSKKSRSVLSTRLANAGLSKEHFLHAVRTMDALPFIKDLSSNGGGGALMRRFLRRWCREERIPSGELHAAAVAFINAIVQDERLRDLNRELPTHDVVRRTLFLGADCGLLRTLVNMRRKLVAEGIGHSPPVRALNKLPEPDGYVAFALRGVPGRASKFDTPRTKRFAAWWKISKVPAPESAAPPKAQKLVRTRTNRKGPRAPRRFQQQHADRSADKVRSPPPRGRRGQGEGRREGVGEREGAHGWEGAHRSTSLCRIPSPHSFAAFLRRIPSRALAPLPPRVFSAARVCRNLCRASLPLPPPLAPYTAAQQLATPVHANLMATPPPLPRSAEPPFASPFPGAALPMQSASPLARGGFQGEGGFGAAAARWEHDKAALAAPSKLAYEAVVLAKKAPSKASAPAALVPGAAPGKGEMPKGAIKKVASKKVAAPRSPLLQMEKDLLGLANAAAVAAAQSPAAPKEAPAILLQLKQSRPRDEAAPSLKEERSARAAPPHGAAGPSAAEGAVSEAAGGVEIPADSALRPLGRFRGEEEGGGGGRAADRTGEAAWLVEFPASLEGLRIGRERKSGQAVVVDAGGGARKEAPAVADVLASVGGRSVEGLPFEAVAQLLATAAFPLVLGFRRGQGAAE